MTAVDNFQQRLCLEAFYILSLNLNRTLSSVLAHPFIKTLNIMLKTAPRGCRALTRLLQSLQRHTAYISHSYCLHKRIIEQQFSEGKRGSCMKCMCGLFWSLINVVMYVWSSTFMSTTSINLLFGRPLSLLPPLNIQSDLSSFISSDLSERSLWSTHSWSHPRHSQQDAATGGGVKRAASHTAASDCLLLKSTTWPQCPAPNSSCLTLFGSELC